MSSRECVCSYKTAPQIPCHFCCHWPNISVLYPVQIITISLLNTIKMWISPIGFLALRAVYQINHCLTYNLRRLRCAAKVGKSTKTTHNTPQYDTSLGHLTLCSWGQGKSFPFIKQITVTTVLSTSSGYIVGMFVLSAICHHYHYLRESL